MSALQQRPEVVTAEMMSNVTVKRRTSITTPTAADGKRQDFIAAISEIFSSRPDPQEASLANSNLRVFVDDLASHNQAPS